MYYGRFILYVIKIKIERQKTMKTKTFLKTISLLLTLVMALSLFAACNEDPQTITPPDDDTDKPGDQVETVRDISGYTIVQVSGNSAAAESATHLKEEIEGTMGLSLSIKEDSADAGEKEILIGETNREESQETVKYLEKKNNREAYAIRIYPNDKIVITGTDDASTERAVKVFVKSYVKASAKGTMLDISAGTQTLGQYDTAYTSTLINGTDITVDHVSAVIECNTKYTLPDGTYAYINPGAYTKITELRYQQNEEYNGRLIAMAGGNVESGNATKGDGSIFMSEDQGKTWKWIARPKHNPDLFPVTITGPKGAMAHIYELPAQVGDMPAGTLIYAHNAVNYSNGHGEDGQSYIALWRSYDGGYTWDQDVIVDEAMGIGWGVWEPFMIYCEEDQYLYCFYSDDSDPICSQMVVYKRSKDGVNWEGEGGKVGTGTGKDVDPVRVVANPNVPEARPGMVAITKMGNGEYFMVYEQSGYGGGVPIYYKKTKNLADWGDPSKPGTRIVTIKGVQGITAPCCAWVPAGGECGTLIVTSKSTSNGGTILASSDYGMTWETFTDPLESDPVNSNAGNDRMGYSAGFWVGADGKTLYYINSDNSAFLHSKYSVYFVKFTISDPVIEPEEYDPFA